MGCVGVTIANKDEYIAGLRAEVERLLNEANERCDKAAMVAMEIRELEETP